MTYRPLFLRPFCICGITHNCECALASFVYCSLLCIGAVERTARTHTHASGSAFQLEIELPLRSFWYCWTVGPCVYACALCIQRMFGASVFWMRSADERKRRKHRTRVWCGAHHTKTENENANRKLCLTLRRFWCVCPRCPCPSLTGWKLPSQHLRVHVDRSTLYFVWRAFGAALQRPWHKTLRNRLLATAMDSHHRRRHSGRHLHIFNWIIRTSGKETTNFIARVRIARDKST